MSGYQYTGRYTRLGKKITKLGRPKGRKDNPSKPRRKSGYYQRWANKKITPYENRVFDKENK